MVRVATVLSARDWEPRLVADARDRASLSIVLRAFQPDDIDRRRTDIDVVVVGAETPWVSSGQIAAWRRSGLGVVGVAADGDDPAIGLLEVGGCDEILPDSAPIAAMVQAIRFVAPGREKAKQPEIGSVVGVVGARGAPGRTEVSVAFAAHTASQGRRTVIIDLDLDAPSLAVRLSLPPRPDIIDVADAVRADGRIREEAVHSTLGFDVVSGSHRRDGSRLRPGEPEGIVRAARSSWDVIVVDVGPEPGFEAWERQPDEIVLVAEGTAMGLVRTARLIEDWTGPAPALVINRIDRRRRSEVVDAARKWTGLDPAALVPEHDGIRRASASAKAPARPIARPIARLAVPS